MARLLFVQPSIMPPGGGNVLTAWMLQALATEHRVTLLTMDPPRFDVVDRHSGTTLASRSFDVAVVPPAGGRLARRVPIPATLYHSLHLMRAARRVVAGYDLAITADNEADLGPPGIQYVHFPRFTLDRPEWDLRWYSRLRVARRAYQSIGCRMFGYSGSRMRRNLTLVNSAYIRAMVARALGIDATVVHPPIPGVFPDVPWGRRDDGFVCLSRLSPEKRLLEVLEILAAVRRRHPTITLDLVGMPDDHDYARRLEERARAQGSWVRLHRDVPRDALASLVAGRRYGIHAMADEPFGMAVAEMVRAGCIVFAPDTAGPAEIVGAHPPLLFDGSAQAIERIDAVLGDPDAQNRARSHLATRAQLFTTERFVAEIRALVAGALGRRGA